MYSAESLSLYIHLLFRLVEEKKLAAAVVDSEERKLAAAVAVVDSLAPELILHRHMSRRIFPLKKKHLLLLWIL